MEAAKDLKPKEEKRLTETELLRLNLFVAERRVQEEIVSRLRVTSENFRLRASLADIDVEKTSQKGLQIEAHRVEFVHQLGEKYNVDWRVASYDDETGVITTGEGE